MNNRFTTIICLIVLLISICVPVSANDNLDIIPEEQQNDISIDENISELS